MKLIRLFSSDKYKGEKNYINNQRLDEIARTVLLFALAAAVYLIGFLTTHTNKNLLTIVAVLGVLPAAKSAVNMIMFLRFKSCDRELAAEFEEVSEGLCACFDRVFTSYEKNYVVDHLFVSGKTLIGYTSKKSFPESDFEKHIGSYLKAEGYKDMTIKVFEDKDKYLERLSSFKGIEAGEREAGIMNVLLSISL